MCKEVEVVWFVYGVRTKNNLYGLKKFYGRGHAAFVDFNWKKGLNPIVLGWLHTHPNGSGCEPSETDNKTMRSWVKALARPMICGIQCDGTEVWYEYYRGEDRRIWRVVLEVKTKMEFIYGFRKGTPESC